MAWNGAGVFSRIYNWVNDANAAIAITASRMDGEDDGFATGLNNCLTKNGENSPTANLPMATYKHTGVGNAAARNQYLAAGQQQDNDCIYGVASGTDTYTLTPTPAITAYVAGQEFIVKFTNANTGAATLNVSSVGAKDITKGVSTALVAGDIVAAQLYRCRYDGTRFVLVGRELNATATTSGVVELATDAETVTGTDTARACTPANITAKMAAPGAIGGTTPAAGTFTTLNSTGGALNGTLGGTTPAAVTATTIVGTSVAATAGVTSSSATAGVGYATGAGGTVTQLSSKSTGVTLNKVCGTITTHNASLNNATTVAFTVTNSTVAATDTVILSIKQTGATASAYSFWVDEVATGSFVINIRNFSGGALGEAIALNFVVIKGVAA